MNHVEIEESTKISLIAYGFPIKTIKIETEKLKGGYICDTFRVIAEYDLSSDSKYLPKTFVLKIEECNCNDADIVKELNLYEREWTFYTEFSSLIRESGVHCPIYYGPLIIENKIIGVILEDLCVINIPHQNPPVSNSILCPVLYENGVSLTSRAIARLHAPFYISKPEKMKMLVSHVNKGLFNLWQIKLQSSWPKFKERWALLLEELNAVDIFEIVISKFNLIQDKLASGATTFLHGDVKPANMFLLEIPKDSKFNIGMSLSSSKEEYLVETKTHIPSFIDWQYIAIGKGVCDLAFFLIEGFEPDISAKMEKIALDSYHNGLLENGYDYPGGISALELDWKFAVAHFPVYVCLWFGVSDNVVDPTFPERIIRRTIAALERHNVRETLIKLE